MNTLLKYYKIDNVGDHFNLLSTKGGLRLIHVNGVKSILYVNGIYFQSLVFLLLMVILGLGDVISFLSIFVDFTCMPLLNV